MILIPLSIEKCVFACLFGVWDVDIHGHPRYTVTNVRVSLIKMSLKRASLLAPKRAVFVAGAFFAAARRLRAGDASESPYGSGDR
jgi:hypothetical protein